MRECIDPRHGWRPALLLAALFALLVHSGGHAVRADAPLEASSGRSSIWRIASASDLPQSRTLNFGIGKSRRSRGKAK